jgi:ketol-acid reductoisomerase
MVNKKIKPIINNKGVLKFNHPPQIVANQEKILIPVGIAITIVAAVK